MVGLPNSRLARSGRKIFVETTEQEALAAAEKHYGEKRNSPATPTCWILVFLRALAIHARLADKTPELERYCQTDALCTGFDIIFFWSPE